MTRGRYGGIVYRVAIVGGIGAGKSAATEYLAARGFPVVDADLVARDVVAPGHPGFRAIVDAFGRGVLDDQGELDRPFVADVVFHDESARHRLNAITHPFIGEEMLRQLDAASGTAVFVAIPLYRATHRVDLELDQVWAVVVDRATAVHRLTTQRGFSEGEAQLRLDAQVDPGELVTLADRVIRNDGSRADLHAALDDAVAGLT